MRTAKEYLHRAVSTYRTSTDLHGADSTVQDVLEGIIGGTYREAVAAARRLYALIPAGAPEDKKERAKWKKGDPEAWALWNPPYQAYCKCKRFRLPGFITAGTFRVDHRHGKTPPPTHLGRFPDCSATGLVEHTGLVILDFDHLLAHGAVAEDLLGEFAAHPAVVGAFNSLSDDGVKPLLAVSPVPTNDAEHEAAYWACVAAVSDIYTDIDSSGQNVARLCFMSDSPTGYIAAPEKPIIEVPWELAGPKQDAGSARAKPRAGQKYPPPTEADVTSALVFLAAQGVGADDSALLAVGICMKSNGRGFAEWSAWAESAGCSCPDRETRWGSLTSRDQDYATIMGMARNRGWKKPRATRRSPDVDREGGHGLTDPHLLEPRGDCNRLLLKYANRLLLVRHPHQQPNQKPIPMAALVLDANGATWGGDIGTLRQFHDRAAKAEAERVAGGDGNRGDMEKAVGYLRAARTTRGFAEMLADLEAAYLTMGDEDCVPSGLTVCDAQDLYWDTLVLGCPNGVVCLVTGGLLPAGEGRRKLVTRSTGTDFVPDATDPRIDRLTAHLDEATRQYVLQALRFAMRGNPARRWYVVVGPPNGGKSTLVGTAVAVLGCERDGGYGVSLPAAALLVERNSHPNAHSEHLMGLNTGRIALSSEVPKGGAPFNNGALKQVTDGITALNIRGVGERGAGPRPATATIFQTINGPDLQRSDLTDEALADRTRIIPYPELPGEIAEGFAREVQTDPDCRRAMLALLVQEAVTAVHPPKSILSVAEATLAQRERSIGEVGRWIQRRLRVTGQGKDRLSLDALFAELSESVPPAGAKWEAMTRQGVLGLARELVAGFPATKSLRIDGKVTSGLQGVVLLPEQEEPDEPEAPQQGAELDDEPFNGAPPPPMCHLHGLPKVSKHGSFKPSACPRCELEAVPEPVEPDPQPEPSREPRPAAAPAPEPEAKAAQPNPSPMPTRSSFVPPTPPAECRVCGAPETPAMELSPGRVCQSCQSICRECGTGTGGTTADLCTDCRRQVSRR